jgi:hypothetical protein
MRKLTTLIIVQLLLFGCAAPMATKMNNVSVGMTKAEVIQVMGTPKSVSAKDGVEYLNYRFATSFMDTDGSDTSDYFVRLVSGRVDSYGQKGDFGTTQKLQDRVQIEVINKKD